MSGDIPFVQGKIAALVISLVLLGLSYETLRGALADHYYRANTLASLTRAAEIDPSNAQTWLWLAEHQEYAGVDSTRALETAARLSPYDSTPVIRLALRAELEGQRARAEQLLLEAAAIDRLYEPRWSLANFYFRSGDSEKFWPAVRSALDMAYGDQTPLYRLCWRFTSDPAQILRYLPNRRLILAGYLRFLLENKHAADASTAAQSLSESAAPEDLQLLLTYLDQSPDLSVWNTLCRRALLPYSELDPNRGPILTNPDFRAAPLLHGFDWRVTNTADLAAARTAPSGLRITLSGGQPESCELLSQLLAVTPGRRYRFQFEYHTSGIAPKTGLRWTVAGATTPDLSSDTQENTALDFTAAAALERLALTCTRVPGATRIEGTIHLRNLSISPLSIAPQ
jgi:hypothetical protein